MRCHGEIIAKDVCGRIRGHNETGVKMKKLEDIVKKSISGMIDVALMNKLVPRIVKGLKDAGVCEK